MKLNVKKLAPYAKAVVAACGVIVLLAKAVADGTLTGNELVQVGTAVAVALGVYQVPNKAVRS